MALEVASLCGYLCNVSVHWRAKDFDSYKWIKALKGEQLNKYALVPVNGQERRLTSENLPDAIQWFGEMAVAYLKKKKIAGPFVIIPVPNSSSLVGSPRPRTRKLAKAVADCLADGRSCVLDCLRWKENLGSASSEGGPREAERLYKNLLVLREPVEAFRESAEDEESFHVLLVDDVTTSGGHLRASAAKLKKVGLEVDSAICCGKTVYDQKSNAFDICEEELEEYEP